jgi:Flp pilus assembly protein TadD
VDLRPQNPAYLDSLGWAYYKNGELLEARTWLRRAMDAAPERAEIKEHFLTVTGEK